MWIDPFVLAFCETSRCHVSGDPPESLSATDDGADVESRIVKARTSTSPIVVAAGIVRVGLFPATPDVAALVLTVKAT